ncbi:MAG TPA: hypothetical protein VMI11_07330 [Actinomycetes bacterium]|nr:hypothetical protein [Actinomycetes bacterium]
MTATAQPATSVRRRSRRRVALCLGLLAVVAAIAGVGVLATRAGETPPIDWSQVGVCVQHTGSISPPRVTTALPASGVCATGTLRVDDPARAQHVPGRVVLSFLVIGSPQRLPKATDVLVDTGRRSVSVRSADASHVPVSGDENALGLGYLVFVSVPRNALPTAPFTLVDGGGTTTVASLPES